MSAVVYEVSNKPRKSKTTDTTQFVVFAPSIKISSEEEVAKARIIYHKVA